MGKMARVGATREEAWNVAEGVEGVDGGEGGEGGWGGFGVGAARYRNDISRSTKKTRVYTEVPTLPFGVGSARPGHCRDEPASVAGYLC